MSSRSRVKKGKDKKIFSKGADRVKKMNIAPKVARGGIRL